MHPLTVGVSIYGPELRCEADSACEAKELTVNTQGAECVHIHYARVHDRALPQTVEIAEHAASWNREVHLQVWCRGVCEFARSSVGVTGVIVEVLLGGVWRGRWRRGSAIMREFGAALRGHTAVRTHFGWKF